MSRTIGSLAWLLIVCHLSGMQCNPMAQQNSSRPYDQTNVMLNYIARQVFAMDRVLHATQNSTTMLVNGLYKNIHVGQNATNTKLDIIRKLLQKPAVVQQPNTTVVQQPNTTVVQPTDDQPTVAQPPPTPSPPVPPHVGQGTVVSSCADPRIQVNGVYQLSNGLQAYCDATHSGGGWTVIQRRHNGSLNFFRNWDAYRAGFGSLFGEFWYGNDNLHALTQGPQLYLLRVDMLDYEGNYRYAEYQEFTVGPESSNYALQIENYSGTAFDALGFHEGQQFSTYDRDNDRFNGNCATRDKGGFWYSNCGMTNLNGPYRNQRGEVDSDNDKAFEPDANQYIPHPLFTPFGTIQQRQPLPAPFGRIGSLASSKTDSVYWKPAFSDNRPMKHVEMKFRPANHGRQ